MSAVVVLATLLLACGEQAGGGDATATTGEGPAPSVGTAGGTVEAASPFVERALDAHLVRLEELEELLGTTVRLSEGPRDAPLGGAPPPCGSRGIELAGFDPVRAPHTTRWYAFSGDELIGGAAVLEYESADDAEEMMTALGAALEGCSEFEQVGLSWTVEAPAEREVGEDVLVVSASSDRAYPPGRGDGADPAGRCWVYARSGALLGSAGAVGPESVVSQGTCTELASTALTSLDRRFAPVGGDMT